MMLMIAVIMTMTMTMTMTMMMMMMMIMIMLMMMMLINKDMTVKLWDVAKERCKHTFTDHNQARRLCPVSLLISSLLRFRDSYFLNNSLWAWEFHPLN